MHCYYFIIVPKRKRPQKPAVQVDDTEIKGMSQPAHPLLLSYYTDSYNLMFAHVSCNTNTKRDVLCQAMMK